MLPLSEMQIVSPANLQERIKCKRIRVGGLNGFKPNVIKLSTGELLMTNFHGHNESQGDGDRCEHIMLFRSEDNGLTWSASHYDHLHGREPYLNVFINDMVIMTTHFLAGDVRNKTGHVLIMLHRSEDQGHTWESREIDISMIPDEVDMTCSSRNIIELDDGNIMMGVGCGNGKDYLFLSSDKGKTWKIERSRFYGCAQETYKYSAYQEGVFWMTDTGRLMLLARCEPVFMDLQDIPGMPMYDFDKADSDHFAVEILFDSGDKGLTWHVVQAVPLVSVMYPSVLTLGEGRYLLTFTVREPMDGNHMGVQAIFMHEKKDGGIEIHFDRDRIVFDEKTPDYLQTGGGFGNTIMLGDGTLLTPYSYYWADDDIIDLMKSGRFFEEQTFENMRKQAARYFGWAGGFSYESCSEASESLKRHRFLGCCSVLGKAGTATEVALWNLENALTGIPRRTN